MVFTKFKPSKKYLAKIKKFAGRNKFGRITVRHQGGGNKIKYRIIDWSRNTEEAFVTSLEYDPNRTSNIAKVYAPKTQTYKYIVAPKGLKTFDKVISLKKLNKSVRFNVGDSSLLNNFEFGDFLHNVSLTPNTKGLFARAAGTYCQLLEHTSNNYVKLRLPSGQQRLIPNTAIATLGIVGNEDSNLKNLKKAGRSRWLNRRPSVRGVAMNPVDHPHGGGQGKTKGGRPSVTPWSWPTKGQPTRNPRKKNPLILKNK